MSKEKTSAEIFLVFSYLSYDLTSSSFIDFLKRRPKIQVEGSSKVKTLHGSTDHKQVIVMRQCDATWAPLLCLR